MGCGSHTFRDLLEAAHQTVHDPEDGEVHRTLDKALFARLLQARARGYRSFLASFLVWLVTERGLSERTARRKVRLVGAAIADFGEEPWLKLTDWRGERSCGVTPTTAKQIGRALLDYAEFLIETSEDEGFRAFAREIAGHLKVLPEEIETNIALRRARKQREERMRDENVNQPPARRGSKGRRP